MTEIPLGQLENQRLEFKSAGVLDSPEKIAREVVGMLNAEGGEVWVGLREEDGRAMEIEPISDAESAKDRLHDHLVDTLEPAPTGEEVVMEAVELAGNGENGSILRIIAQPLPNRRPYAWVRNGGWNFPIRIGARLRPMSREEVQRNFSNGSTGTADNRAKAKKTLIDLQRQTLDAGVEGLWIAVVPAPETTLDIHSLRKSDLLIEPRETGNRRAGATFVASHRPEIRPDGLRWRNAETWGVVEAELWEEIGSARFFAGIEELAPSDELDPYALVEYPVSAFRILAEVYKAYESHMPFFEELLADLAILGVGGRGLRPGSPGSFRHGSQREPWTLHEGPDFLLKSPAIFTREEVIREPDRCALRLLRKVYQGFGLPQEDMPVEFNQNIGRLILPE